LNRLLYLFLLASCCAAAQPAGMGVATDTVMVDTAFVAVRDTVATRPKPVHFQSGFRSRYKDAAFRYHAKSVEKSRWEKFKEKLADFFDRLFSIRPKSGAETTLGLILKIVVGLVIITVLYLLVRAMVSREGKWIFGRNSDRGLLRYEAAADDVRHADFAALVGEALQSGDRRLAVRYYYLWLLKALTRSNHIEWDIEKTNSDYLREIADESLRERFRYLSYLYNNVWYGEFEVDDALFDKTRDAFDQSIRNLKP
jgi:hypothetical protein